MINLINWAEAYLALQAGKRVAREGWKGAGMWASMTPGKTLSLARDTIWTENVRLAAEANGGTVTLRPYFNLYTAQKDIQIGWRPSTSDLMAEDWYVLD